MNAAGSPRSATGGAARRPLKRGKACMNCRFLKIKCDGARPVCGPCMKHPKDDECEFDGPGRSRTKALEEQVNRLQSRIQELEHPGESTPSVTLHEPYSPTHQVQQSPTGSPSSHAGISLSTSISPYEMTPASSGSPLLLDRPQALPMQSSSSGGSRCSPAASDRSKPFSPFEEPDVSIVRVLLENFLPHAAEFGFFLSTSRFHNTALIPAPTGHVSRPLPALLFAVYLFGVHLSPTASVRAQSPALLAQTLQTLSLALTSHHPQRVLHTIQTHVLLAYFFYRSGLHIEAKYHAAAACSLVISSGLHKIRSPNYTAVAGDTPVRGSPILLHKPPADAVEEGERISALWASFTLSRLLAVALDPPDAICGVFDVPGVQIDTPWPLTMDGYEDGGLPDALQSTATVRNFVNNNDWYSGDGTSPPALFAKAVILLHRAAYVAGLFSDPMSPRDYQTFSHFFTTTHALITGFREHLPPLRPALLLTYSLAHAALIKLHMPFFRSDPVSRQQCVLGAQGMFELGTADISRFVCLNPIIGTLWTLAIQVLIDEVARLRTQWAGTAGGMLAAATVPYDASAPSVPYDASATSVPYDTSAAIVPYDASAEEVPLSRLRAGLHALAILADDASLMSTSMLLKLQHTKCQEMFAAANL
ncbi:hypothetical protein BD626DRAFT_540943 [Schizophyllum amplum]|uniref:Zn(2)-C6 fungal-type domain-containing protein n=1 Tax=Schizophyllum amplum TaxID=97359 RepID=A0A550BWD9_9AGAR|nr:hypothetical protein BD626DRAFT_540943 [Auriculariopsis ampla]